MSTHDEALAELRDIVGETASAATDTSYGHFHGGNPNDFSPDPECSTDEERAAHAAACEAWNRGEREPLPGPHAPIGDGRAGWVTQSGFGLGTNVLRDERAEDLAERLSRILERLERDDQ